MSEIYQGIRYQGYSVRFRALPALKQEFYWPQMAGWRTGCIQVWPCQTYHTMYIRVAVDSENVFDIFRLRVERKFGWKQIRIDRVAEFGAPEDYWDKAAEAIGVRNNFWGTVITYDPKANLSRWPHLFGKQPIVRMIDTVLFPLER